MSHHSFIYLFNSFNTYFILGTVFTYSAPPPFTSCSVEFLTNHIICFILEAADMFQNFSGPNKGLQMQTDRIIKKHHEDSNLIWDI